MAGHRNPIAGYLPCPQCRYSVALFKTSTGKLTYSCQGCGMNGYASPGTDAIAAWQHGMKPKETAAPAAGPKPSADAPVSGPKPARSGGFSLGKL